MALDTYLGWRPWATACGAVLGFSGGLYHLVSLLNRHDRGDAPRTGQEKR
jgi:hypothetical protein